MAAVTLFPAVTADQPGGLHLVLGLGDSSVQDFAFNLVLFIPIGITATLAVIRDRCLSLRLASGIVASAACLSYGLEAGQTLLPGRFPSLVDVGANTLGAIVGIGALQLWRTGRTFLLLASTVTFAVVISLLLVRAVRLNWNVDNPLMVGNEQTGDRPWIGRVWYVALLDTAVSTDELRDIMSPQQTGGSIPELPTGELIAAYDLTASGSCRDATQNLAALVWNDGRACVGDEEGARVGHDQWLRTAGSVAPLTERVRRTGQFTLLVRMASSSGRQVGPARIVSISASPDLRNMTLGQDNTDLVVRIRTPLTGLNGIRVPLVGTDAVMPGRVQLVAVTYDGSHLSLFVDGPEPAATVEFGPGLALAAQIVPGHMLPTMVRIMPIEKVYAVLVFAVLGSIAAWLLSQRGALLPSRDWLFLAVLVSTPLVLEALLHLMSGARLDWSRVALGLTSLLGAGAVFRLPWLRTRTAALQLNES